MIRVSSVAKCLIFDCDGTLADTMTLHLEAWKEAFAAAKENYPYELLDRLKGASTDEIIVNFNSLYGRQIDIKKLIADKEKRVYEKLQRAKPISPVVEIAMKYKGLLPLAVVSNGARINVLLTLKTIGLRSFFDIIITADDNIKQKPSPDIFLEAARQLDIKPECCQVFEDSDFGLEAASKAQMIATDVRKFI